MLSARKYAYFIVYALVALGTICASTKGAQASKELFPEARWSHDLDRIERMRLTKNLFTIVIASYLQEGTEHYNGEYNPDLWVQNIYFNEFLSHWQDKVMQMNHGSSEEIFDMIKKSNGILSQYYSLWLSTTSPKGSLKLGYTRHVALKQILLSEQIEDTKKRLLKIIDITKQHLLANSKDYMSAVNILKVLEQSNDLEIKITAKNSLEQIPKVKILHIANSIKNFFAYSRVLPPLKKVYDTGFQILNKITRALLPKSHMSKFLGLSAGVHGTALSLTDNPFYRFPVDEPSDEIEFSKVLRDFNRQAYQLMPDSWWVRHSLETIASKTNSFEKSMTNASDYINEKSHRFDHFNFYVTAEQKFGLGATSQLKDLGLDLAQRESARVFQTLQKIVSSNILTKNKIPLIRKLLVHGHVSEYRGKYPQLTSMLYGFGGNCIGQSLYMISMLQPFAHKLGSYKLGAAHFSDHIEAVLYNDKDLIMLVSGKYINNYKLVNFDGAITKPAFLVWETLHKQKLLSRNEREFPMHLVEYLPIGATIVDGHREKPLTSILYQTSLFEGLGATGNEAPDYAKVEYQDLHQATYYLGANELKQVKLANHEGRNRSKEQTAKDAVVFDLHKGDYPIFVVVWYTKIKKVKFHNIINSADPANPRFINLELPSLDFYHQVKSLYNKQGAEAVLHLMAEFNEDYLEELFLHTNFVALIEFLENTADYIQSPSNHTFSQQGPYVLTEHLSEITSTLINTAMLKNFMQNYIKNGKLNTDGIPFGTSVGNSDLFDLVGSYQLKPTHYKSIARLKKALDNFYNKIQLNPSIYFTWQSLSTNKKDGLSVMRYVDELILGELNFHKNHYPWILLTRPNAVQPEASKFEKDIASAWRNLEVTVKRSLPSKCSYANITLPKASESWPLKVHNMRKCDESTLTQIDSTAGADAVQLPALTIMENVIAYDGYLHLSPRVVDELIASDTEYLHGTSGATPSFAACVNNSNCLVFLNTNTSPHIVRYRKFISENFPNYADSGTAYAGCDIHELDNVKRAVRRCTSTNNSSAPDQ